MHDSLKRTNLLPYTVDISIRISEARYRVTIFTTVIYAELKHPISSNMSARFWALI